MSAAREDVFVLYLPRSRYYAVFAIAFDGSTRRQIGAHEDKDVANLIGNWRAASPRFRHFHPLGLFPTY